MMTTRFLLIMYVIVVVVYVVACNENCVSRNLTSAELDVRADVRFLHEVKTIVATQTTAIILYTILSFIIIIIIIIIDNDLWKDTSSLQ